jgi:hypothetical protein
VRHSDSRYIADHPGAPGLADIGAMTRAKDLTVKADAGAGVSNPHVCAFSAVAAGHRVAGKRRSVLEFAK